MENDADVSLVFHGIWQARFVDETEAAKVERVKQEKGIFWEPTANMTVEEAKWPSLQVWVKHYQEILPSLHTDKTKTSLVQFLSSC